MLYRNQLSTEELAYFGMVIVTDYNQTIKL